MKKPVAVLCLHTEQLTGMEAWRAAHDAALQAVAALRFSPESITVDDVPGLPESPISLDKWQAWLRRQEQFPEPSLLVLSGRGESRGLLSLFGGASCSCAISTSDFGQISLSCGSKDLSLFAEAARCFAAKLRVRYGYALHSDNPVGFAHGTLAARLTPDETSERIRWRKHLERTPEGAAYMRWLQERAGVPINVPTVKGALERRLRDVFPLSLLSAEHLKLRVGQQTLYDWIKADNARGELRDLSSGLHAWRIDADRAPLVRQMLLQYEVLASGED